MLNKINSLLCFINGLVAGFMSFLFMAGTGFSGGIQTTSLLVIIALIVTTVLFLILSVLIWRGGQKPRILALIISICLSLFYIFIMLREDNSTGLVWVFCGLLWALIVLILLSFKKKSAV